MPGRPARPILAAARGYPAAATRAQVSGGANPAILPLKDAYARHFLIGMAGDIPGNYSDAELQLIKQTFNAVTPENCMKPQSVHPAEYRWTFGAADALVKFCIDNHIQVVGHCLVWHSQTGNWFFRAPAGQQMTKELLLARLKTHIQTEVGRYKGKVKGWDVVNEAINDRPAPARTSATATGNASSATTTWSMPSSTPTKPTLAPSYNTTITTSKPAPSTPAPSSCSDG